jgi:hypothetical protein
MIERPDAAENRTKKAILVSGETVRGRRSHLMVLTENVRVTVLATT